MKKILIIGGTGHVSGAVLREALHRNFDVTVVTRGRRPVPAGVRSLVCDRSDAEAMRQLFGRCGENFDAVADCVCYRPEDFSVMLELFRKNTGTILFISTDFVYDSTQRRYPQDIDAPLLKNDGNGYQSYGFRKLQCEQLLQHEPKNGVNWTIFRPCHIYGPTSLPGCYPCHCRDAALLDLIRNGQPLRLVGGGHDLQQPIDADDLGRLFWSALDNPAASRKIFNAAGPEIVESVQYYRLIAEALGKELNVQSVDREAHLAAHPEDLPFLCHRVYDNSLLTQAGLEAPSLPLREGLARHIWGLTQQTINQTRKEWL